MVEDDIYSTIRGDCDGCPEKYCGNRNHHELAWFLCRNPNKPKHPGRKMPNNRISRKYTDEHCNVDYKVHKVCDRCATIVHNKYEFCILCGYDKFTPMSESEAILLSIPPAIRDYS